MILIAPISWVLGKDVSLEGFGNWRDESSSRRLNAKGLEEANNRFYIAKYDLQGELSFGVTDE